jgi:hypothetical protein
MNSQLSCAPNAWFIYSLPDHLAHVHLGLSGAEGKHKDSPRAEGWGRIQRNSGVVRGPSAGRQLGQRKSNRGTCADLGGEEGMVCASAGLGCQNVLEGGRRTNSHKAFWEICVFLRDNVIYAAPPSPESLKKGIDIR